MSKRMLVDATHPEEIRVAIVEDNRLIDLEIESSGKEQIKGNIYLGKVTRVEPSLQAAFVEFNGGRQGFLPASDIHPKYYPLEPGAKEAPARKESTAAGEQKSADEDTLTYGGEMADEEDEEEMAASPAELPDEEDDEDEDDDEEAPPPAARRSPRRRRLPIQSILTRGQTLLVQVVKEARGTKGAALTTNLALPGRYCVLLPDNTGGGGISRKITDALERKALKEVLTGLEVPNDVSLIIRTAGMGRTKREIKRDQDYLLRLWKKIQDKAAASQPPALIYEEGDLIIRTIRDLYSTDMEEILIEGADGYRRGKDFMRLLMPRYQKVVQPYKDRIPLFSRYKVEDQIESMHERVVTLKSGGYLVLDPTEALVSIDINSGRATREKDIESTAFKTNLEASDEIARQLRIQDLGGLIVIDYIDMDDKRHNAEVEKRLKDAMKLDRAKIQIGRISQFGLLELSRQRLKPAFSETNRQVCPRCLGLGTVRSVESAAIHIYRCMEEDAASGKYRKLVYRTPHDVAHFLLNNKRSQIAAMEMENDVSILVLGDSELQTPDFHTERTDREGNVTSEVRKQQLESDRRGRSRGGRNRNRSGGGRAAASERQEGAGRSEQQAAKPERQEAPAAQAAQAAPGGQPPQEMEGVDASGKKRRRRRRRRKKGVGEGMPAEGMTASGEGTSPMADGTAAAEGAAPAVAPPHPVAQPAGVPGLYTLPPAAPAPVSEEEEEEAAEPEQPEESTPEGSASTAEGEKPRRKRRRRRRRKPPTGETAPQEGMAAGEELEQPPTPEGMPTPVLVDATPQPSIPREQPSLLPPPPLPGLLMSPPLAVTETPQASGEPSAAAATPAEPPAEAREGSEAAEAPAEEAATQAEAPAEEAATQAEAPAEEAATAEVVEEPPIEAAEEALAAPAEEQEETPPWQEATEAATAVASAPGDEGATGAADAEAASPATEATPGAAAQGTLPLEEPGSGPEATAEQPAPVAEKAPARRTRKPAARKPRATTRSKAAAPQEAAESAPSTSGETATGEEEPAAKPAPKPRRRRAPAKKAAPASSEGGAEGTAAAASPAEESTAGEGAVAAEKPAPKPRRRRAPSKKAPAKSEETPPQGE